MLDAQYPNLDAQISMLGTLFSRLDTRCLTFIMNLMLSWDLTEKVIVMN